MSENKEYHVSVKVFGGNEFYMSGHVTPDGKVLVGNFTEVETQAWLEFIKGLESMLKFLNTPPPAEVKK